MKKVYESITHYVKPGQRIVIGLSGGPDSVALLHLLLDYREELKLELVACHLHHQLRTEADEDLEFVRKLCAEVDVPLHERRLDVKSYGRDRGMSIEEAGRELRYKFYRDIAREGDLIALGHHRGDQAETLLMRLMRGTGINGLGGMRVLEGDLFRPLLHISKREILDYLHGHGYQYCIDHTNFESIYGRNKVRLELIPLMEEFNPSLEERLDELSLEAQETQDYFDDLIELHMPKIVDPSKHRMTLSINLLSELAPVVRKRLFKRALSEFYGTSQNITRDYIRMLEELLNSESGTQFTIRDNVLVRRDFNDIIIEYPRESVDLEERILHLGENTWSNNRVYVKIVEKMEPQGDALFFQAEDLGLLSIRSRQAGDRVLMFNGHGHKKLKDILIENKVDKNLRDKVPIICRNGEILSVYGNYRSGHNLIGDNEGLIYKIYIEVNDAQRY